VASLKAVGDEILSAEYKSALSSWKFDPPTEVTDRQAAVDAKMADLTSLSTAKRAVLDARLANEIEKERLRLLFATQAGEFTTWTSGLAEDLPKTHFGFNLAEVEAFQAKLDAEDAETKNTSASKTAAFTQTLSDAEAAGVKDNKYTTLTLATLADSAATVEAAQAARQAAYATELERVRYNDSLCQKFAGIANPLAAAFDSNKESITSASGDLEPQIEVTTAKLAEEGDHKAKTAEAAAVHAEMDSRGVEYNPHSHLNASDLEMMVAQYIEFLNKKDAQLKEELEYKRMRGLTAAQFEEIDQQFKEFDKSGDGKLSKSEFKSCLFSLGEEKSSREVAETMEKYGTEAGIPYEGFKEFMISQLGDTDTKPEILEGWELINKGEPVAKVVHMKETILRDEDVEYLQETAPKAGDDYDYTAWTEDVFAR
jgi:actinin alpha